MLGLLFAALERGFDNFLQRLTDPQMILKLVLLAGFIMTVSLVFTNWYLKKLYGNHLEKLQSLLQDLKDSSTQSV